MKDRRGGTAVAARVLAVTAVLALGLCMGVVLERSADPGGAASPGGVGGPHVLVRATPAAASTPIVPVPVPTGLDPREVALGRRLFRDGSLSVDGTISCADCHDVAKGGDDGRVRSIGIGGAVGDLNAPTVLNAGFNFRQFWDGRARTLEEQVDGPLLAPHEMGSSWAHVLGALTADPGYVRSFEAIYGHGPTADDVRHAIATYERSLVTLNSPFDRFLEGDRGALSADAREGYGLFTDLGCVACHQGVNVGGNMFQPFGTMDGYFDHLDRPERPSDLGRYNVTHRPRDAHCFKVPALRNVALTAPYFHDGSAETLAEAVQVMARCQLGEELEPREVDRLVAFLRSLTGELTVDDDPASVRR